MLLLLVLCWIIADIRRLTRRRAAEQKRELGLRGLALLGQRRPECRRPPLPPTEAEARLRLEQARDAGDAAEAVILDEIERAIEDGEFLDVEA